MGSLDMAAVKMSDIHDEQPASKASHYDTYWELHELIGVRSSQLGYPELASDRWTLSLVVF